MVQKPQQKARYTKSSRKESGEGEEPRTNWHRGKFPEQNHNGLGSKINNKQMGHLKNELFPGKPNNYLY